MILDIGIVDVATCQPMPNVMIEVWSRKYTVGLIQNYLTYLRSLQPMLSGYGSTFLRGAFTSAANGVTEFQTLFLGYNSDGVNHINVMIHTFNVLPGTTSHVGQVFFTDQWTDVVAMTSPYNQNTHHRVLNTQNSNYATANSEGYNAIVE